jgi:hypothetical protein
VCEHCGNVQASDWSPDLVPGQDIGVRLQAFLGWINNYYSTAKISRPLNSQNFALICQLKRFSPCVIKVVDKIQDSIFQIIGTDETCSS